MLDRIVMPRLGNKAWISWASVNCYLLRVTMDLDPYGIVQHSRDMDLLAHF